MKKFNEYAHLYEGDPFGTPFNNLFPEMALTVNILYMVFATCGLDDTFNAFATFCWYKGCWPMEMVFKTGKKFLYIFRAINDAAIVWVEGMRDADDMRDYKKISTGTGKAIAGIFQDITGFEPIPKDEQY